MLIADAHLDLSYNALRGRDVTLPAKNQKKDDEGTPTVGLPDLRAGGVSLVCATIFCEPASRSAVNGYHTPDQAHAMGQQHLRWYQEQAQRGQFTLITQPQQLPLALAEPDKLHLILLMEGADPLRNEQDVHDWFAAGLRIVGLAWKRTRLAGGTGDPGPLTPEGIQLVKWLDAKRIIHDVSHLAEQSFWDLLNLTSGPVMASHSNARKLIPTDRQLSDEMAKALVERGGVIGINFYSKFLLSAEDFGRRPATLADVVRQLQYFADLFGHAKSIAIGTDMDGGFGREKTPVELVTAAQLPLLADALSQAKFSDEDVQAIMGQNWLRFFAQKLPSGNR
jgi:membrane dipeptidase